MNRTQADECDTDALYGPGEPVTPAPLLWLALVHNCWVALLGTLGNAVALWCVASCTKTRRPVKVLLSCVFVPILVICVVSRPMVIEMIIALLSCDKHRVSYVFKLIHLFVYSILAQSELAFIAVIAVIRVTAVCTSRKSELGMRMAAALVLCVFVYSVVTDILILGAVVTNQVEGRAKNALEVLYFFLATMLPVLITAAAYALMILAVQRNKSRLAAGRHQARPTKVMNQATRAMLAVFISNLVFSLPHSIYHVMGKLPHYYSVIFHILFSTHFFVDPIVFIYFNLHHRRRVLDLLTTCRQRMSNRLPSPPPRSMTPSAPTNTTSS